MIKTIKQKGRGEEGFSLIELVVAVGILAILSVVGVVAYSSITENARKTTVKNAASEVLTGAVAYDSNGDSVEKAADEWNNSAKENKDGIKSIEVSAEKVGQCIIVVAWHNEFTDLRFTRVSGIDCPVIDDNNGGNNGGNPSDGGGDTPPIIIGNEGRWVVNVDGMFGSDAPHGERIDVDFLIDGVMVDSCSVELRWGMIENTCTYNGTANTDNDSNWLPPQHAIRTVVNGKTYVLTVNSEDFTDYGGVFEADASFTGVDPVEEENPGEDPNPPVEEPPVNSSEGNWALTVDGMFGSDVADGAADIVFLIDGQIVDVCNTFISGSMFENSCRYSGTVLDIGNDSNWLPPVHTVEMTTGGKIYVKTVNSEDFTDYGAVFEAGVWFDGSEVVSDAGPVNPTPGGDTGSGGDSGNIDYFYHYEVKVVLDGIPLNDEYDWVMGNFPDEIARNDLVGVYRNDAGTHLVQTVENLSNWVLLPEPIDPLVITVYRQSDNKAFEIPCDTPVIAHEGYIKGSSKDVRVMEATCTYKG